MLLVFGSDILCLFKRKTDERKQAPPPPPKKVLVLRTFSWDHVDMRFFKISFSKDFYTLNQVVMVCSMSPASDLQIKDIMKPVFNIYIYNLLLFCILWLDLHLKRL